MAVVAQPRYEEIARDVREQIVSGVLAPGDTAPSGPQLRDQYGVAIATANRATALLRSWGLVETITGVGTRVVEQPPASGPSEHTSRLSRGLPIYADGERSVIVEASVITTDVVDPAVLRAVDLPVPPGDLAGEATKIIKRARVMYRGEQVTGLCRTWFNYPLIIQQGRRGAAVVDRLTSTERIPGGTLPVVAELFGVDMSHSTTRVGVRRLPAALARDLLVDPGTPAQWVLETRYADDYVLEVDEWFRLDDVVLT